MPTEPLTRYVTDSERMLLLPTKDHVHWRAFLPKTADKDLSIARIENLAADDVCTLGIELAASGGRTVYGRADFNRPQVQALTVARFDAVPAPPPDRHAAIVGWPEDGNARKRACMELTAVSARHYR